MRFNEKIIYKEQSRGPGTEAGQDVRSKAGDQEQDKISGADLGLGIR